MLEDDAGQLEAVPRVKSLAAFKLDCWHDLLGADQQVPFDDGLVREPECEERIALTQAHDHIKDILTDIVKGAVRLVVSLELLYLLSLHADLLVDVLLRSEFRDLLTEVTLVDQCQI